MPDPATPVEQPERLSAERLADIKCRIDDYWYAEGPPEFDPMLAVGEPVAWHLSNDARDLIAEVAALRSTIAHLEAERGPFHNAGPEHLNEARSWALMRSEPWPGILCAEIDRLEARAAADAPKLQAAPDADLWAEVERRELATIVGYVNPAQVSREDPADETSAFIGHVLFERTWLNRWPVYGLSAGLAALFPDPEDPPAPTYPVPADQIETWEWDTCPHCGWNTERNRLVPSEGCLPDPCSACQWAHEPPLPAEDPQKDAAT